MSYFQDLMFFVHNSPDAEAQTSFAQAVHALSLSCNSTLPARNSFGLLPQGYCADLICYSVYPDWLLYPDILFSVP